PAAAAGAGGGGQRRAVPRLRPGQRHHRPDAGRELRRVPPLTPPADPPAPPRPGRPFRPDPPQPPDPGPPTDPAQPPAPEHLAAPAQPTDTEQSGRCPPRCRVPRCGDAAATEPGPAPDSPPPDRDLTRPTAT